MNKFWTVTDQDTSYTNSKSNRFPTLAAAEAEARMRVSRGIRGVYVLESVLLIRLKVVEPPVERIELLRMPEDLT